MNTVEIKNQTTYIPHLSIHFGGEKITIEPNTPQVVAFLETAAYNTVNLCREIEELRAKLEEVEKNIELQKAENDKMKRENAGQARLIEDISKECARNNGVIRQLNTALAAVEKERDAAVQDIHLVDKCDCCKNNASAELYYDEAEQESFPRRYKCDKCYLGAGERNNFEWRGKERE